MSSKLAPLPAENEVLNGQNESLGQAQQMKHEEINPNEKIF